MNLQTVVVQLLYTLMIRYLRINVCHCTVQFTSFSYRCQIREENANEHNLIQTFAFAVFNVEGSNMSKIILHSFNIQFK